MTASGTDPHLTSAVEALRRWPRYGSLGAPARLATALTPAELRVLGCGVKVTGSNGKGSTSHLIAHALAAHGGRVGLFISPHFLDVRERIQLVTASGRELIPAHGLADAVSTAAAQLAGSGATQFEVLTLAAARWFLAQRVDHVVWEAGIGGRWDATRALPCPVSVLTHVALEHTQLLGTTLAEIAADKCCLATPGGTLVIGPLPAEAEQAARAHTPAARVVHADRSPPMTSLVGRHQVDNAGCAATAVREYLGQSCSEAALARGLMATSVPGRFERVRVGPPEVWVDAAHDPSGVIVAADTARAHFGSTPIILIAGGSADRPIEAMMPPLAMIAAEVVATMAGHRGAPPERIAAACPRGARLAPDTVTALAVATERARALGGVVFATGGLFLAAEIAAAARGRAPEGLLWL